ncbi:MAG TPA: nucleotide exchange factor GrpE [Candidatus Saccharimonadales bacterium]|nr:nucleotide exchange factor GrpE [Candidatus Saccharimonadales bacterium]
MPKQPKQSQHSQPADDAGQQAMQQQVDDLTAALQRERADAMNLRRRHEEQLASLKTHVQAQVVRELLPVIDNFERALKHIPEDLTGNEYIKGVGGIVKQFEKTLAGLGVQKIKTVGQPFDPRYHEAVSMEEGEGDQEVVCEELQSGYTLGEEVLRHAMVRVRMQ